MIEEDMTCPICNSGDVSEVTVDGLYRYKCDGCRATWLFAESKLDFLNKMKSGKSVYGVGFVNGTILCDPDGIRRNKINARR